MINLFIHALLHWQENARTNPGPPTTDHQSNSLSFDWFISNTSIVDAYFRIMFSWSSVMMFWNRSCEVIPTISVCGIRWYRCWTFYNWFLTVSDRQQTKLTCHKCVLMSIFILRCSVTDLGIAVEKIKCFDVCKCRWIYNSQTCLRRPPSGKWSGHY